MPELNWNAATAETVANLSRLIRCDTTNPPGNERPAILAIKDILECDGVPSEEIKILEPAPNRMNLVTRIRGDGSQRPLLLTGHVDVVPVERDHWTRDPFGGEVVNGEVWGRGALDMKGFLVMYMQVFMLARRHKLPLKRDIILAAIADEETLYELGSRYLVDHHRELIDAEYAFNEGGAFTLHMGGIRLYPIQTAEKTICWMKMRAKGTPGHGSIPHPDNAVAHLGEALGRLKRARRLPVHITPTMRSMLSAVASQKGFPVSLLASLIAQPWGADLLLRLAPPDSTTLLSALLTNTVNPTVLRAGTKTNVIPSVAEAEIDCRLLPGQTPQDLMGEIWAITGKGVELEPFRSTPGTEFSTETPLYKLLYRATKKLDPGGIVLPLMNSGATDASEYQRAGITVYGFTPGFLPKEFPVVKLGHGHDERLPVSFIESGLPVLWEVVNEFCAGS
jgi:acetylornithine deacetylase/succinyl-diaminopimelate desuccinylase-like protein